MAAFFAGMKSFFTWCKGHMVTVGFALIGLLGFLFGFMAKKKPVIVQGGPDPVQKAAEQKTVTEDAQAQIQEQEEIQAADDTEVSQQRQVIAQETTETTQVEGNVDQTNQYLKDVSADIGGTPSIPVTVDVTPTGAAGGSK